MKIPSITINPDHWNIYGRCKLCSKEINSRKRAVYIYKEMVICEPCYNLFYRVESIIETDK